MMNQMTHGQMKAHMLELRTNAMALGKADPNYADLMRQYRECRAMCNAGVCRRN